MFRGWLELGEQEIANTSRFLAHARPAMAVDVAEVAAQCGVCHVDYIAYDDSWPELPGFLGDGPYTLTNAPWYDAAIPQSVEFLGIWIMRIEGIGPVPVDRAVNDGIGPGGIAGPHRDRYRTVSVEALVLGCTNVGMQYGIEWLSCQLRLAKSQGGTTLDFLAAHPQDSAVVPASLLRRMNHVVLTQEVRVGTLLNARGQNHQASICSVDWTMAVLDPYTYGPEIVETVVWDDSVTEQIGWAHPPNCDNPASCDEIPVLASVICEPNIVETRPVQPPICSGCIPVCEVQTQTFELPEATGVFCLDQVLTLTITAGADPVSVNFWVQPCGSTDLCERVGFLSLAGLPANATVVANSVSGRAYALVGGNQIRQLGIVYTPSGAPWTRTILEAGQCWELVAQHEPGLDFDVEVSIRGRSA